MGYLYLILANIAGATKGFCGKKLSGHVKGTKDAVLSNTLRMMLCVVIGFFLILFTTGLGAVKIGLTTVLITLLSGVSISFTVIFWLLAVKQSAYIILDVFAMLGLLIHRFLDRSFWREHRDKPGHRIYSSACCDRTALLLQ